MDERTLVMFSITIPAHRINPLWRCAMLACRRVEAWWKWIKLCLGLAQVSWWRHLTWEVFCPLSDVIVFDAWQVNRLNLRSHKSELLLRLRAALATRSFCQLCFLEALRVCLGLSELTLTKFLLCLSNAFTWWSHRHFSLRHSISSNCPLFLGAAHCCAHLNLLLRPLLKTFYLLSSFLC